LSETLLTDYKYSVVESLPRRKPRELVAKPKDRRRLRKYVNYMLAEQDYARFVGERDEDIDVGDEIEVTITDVNDRGQGIARVGELVVYVNGSEPGERVRVKIVKRKATYAIAQVVARR